ncbi:MAG: fibrillarin-like rRNA/tRNA 2'-O-methyltransferase [Candidatus Hydrothermarchaeota archaeon]|nr:fibrillarin-like rRNA/tRNA 2'-O-methyltransferase [Candidatus Hydrothermarchaeota archaeon]
MIEKFRGVYLIDDKLATKNLVAGRKVYGEKLVQEDEVEYRLWNPNRSKLAAAIFNGLGELPLSENSKVLYLGAASGTTASHISDIASQGLVFCVDFSPRVFVKLLEVCELRKNMIPIFADASQPDQYFGLVEKCDVMYQDIAQPNQSEILIENAGSYLKPRGSVIIAIKARSIDVSKKPMEIFDAEIEKLKKFFKISDVVYLEPYEKDHVLVVGRALE